MQNVRYDYSSVHVELPPELADEIVAWGKENVTDDEIFVSQTDPTYGREDDIHITLLYGLHCDTASEIKPLISNFESIKVELKLTDIFISPSKFNVLVIDAFSPQLKELNVKLQSLPFTSKYEAYKPHVTIAYLKKTKGRQHRGLNYWFGRSFYCNHVVFSSKSGIKESLKLDSR